MKRIACIAAAACMVLASCAADRGGEMRLSALGARRIVLERSMLEGVYAELESEHGFWFSDVPLATLAAGTQDSPVESAVVVHAQMVWKPEPGRTPLSATATNTVLRVLVISKGEVGVYGGAGFARPLGKLDDETLEIDLRGGTLTLLESTKGFHDLMSPADLTGVLKARKSVEKVQQWRRGASQFAANAFGKAMWVRADTPGLILSRR